MGPVAVLDSAALDGRDYFDCFSGDERQQILRAGNGQRRQERLAGRLAAKFLFLNQHQGDALPAIVHLTPADLDRFTALDYRSAEVFRSDQVSAGLPHIAWQGGHGRQAVALTHSNGIACAFLGNEEAISVDLERAQPRTPAFYAGNFGESERTWAANVSKRLGLRLPWTFTFLWTAKECLLKTPWFADLSIADLPSMNLRITSGEEQLIHPHYAREFLPGFVFLQADAADTSRLVHVNLAVSGCHDLILTAVERRTA
jgi:phosphopantetheinyl transferase